MLLRDRLAGRDSADCRACVSGCRRSAGRKGLSIRTWSRDEHQRAPALAICTTYRPEPALAMLRDIRDGRLKAKPAVMIGNRPPAAGWPSSSASPFHDVGDAEGEPGQRERWRQLFDQYDVDYIVLARYMRMLPRATSAGSSPAGGSSTCITGCCRRSPASGRITMPSRAHMLTYGATVHFIVPELDAGNQIIHQSTFTRPPRHAAGRDHPHRRIGPRTALPGRRVAPRRRPRGGAALPPRGGTEAVRTGQELDAAGESQGNRGAGRKNVACSSCPKCSRLATLTAALTPGTLNTRSEAELPGECFPSGARDGADELSLIPYCWLGITRPLVFELSPTPTPHALRLDLPHRRSAAARSEHRRVRGDVLHAPGDVGHCRPDGARRVLPPRGRRSDAGGRLG